MHRDDVPIEMPCGVPWNDMARAGDACRYCRTCERPVVDLSAMTERQARRFLAREHGACISYLFDDEGTISFRQPRDRSSTVPAAAGILALVAGCNQTPTPATGDATASASALPAPAQSSSAVVELAAPPAVADPPAAEPPAAAPSASSCVKASPKWHRLGGIPRPRQLPSNNL
jgi:hypothetical protein